MAGIGIETIFMDYDEEKESAVGETREDSNSTPVDERSCAIDDELDGRNNNDEHEGEVVVVNDPPEKDVIFSEVEGFKIFATSVLLWPQYN